MYKIQYGYWVFNIINALIFPYYILFLADTSKIFIIYPKQAHEKILENN